MLRWMGVAVFALVLWMAAGWAGARMGGPEVALRSASAGEVPAPPPAWVPLFGPDLLAPPLEGRRTLLLPLRLAPTPEAPEAGMIRVTFEPDDGIYSTWRPAEGGMEVPLWPDVHDPDYTEGPFHHQTVLEVRGRWFLLPADPFPTPVWVDFSALPRPPDLLRLESGTVVTSPRGDLVVLEILADGIRVRPEQPGDFRCDGGPSLRPSGESFVLRGRELHDPNGHLRIRPKYTRGC